MERGEVAGLYERAWGDSERQLPRGEVAVGFERGDKETGK
jgi:hypothetical protein